MKEGEKEERYENAYFSLFFFLCFSYVVEGSVSLYACHFYLFSLIAIHMCKRNRGDFREFAWSNFSQCSAVKDIFMGNFSQQYPSLPFGPIRY